MKNNKAKQKYSILYITYEFGNDVKGGIGRVINNIVYRTAKQMDVTIAYLNYKPSLLIVICNIIHIKKICTVKKSYKEQYFDTLYKLLKKKHFDIVHVTHPGVESARCVKIIKENFPKIKIIYSIHSILKYEKDIRNNSIKMLNTEDYIINNTDCIHLLNKSSLKYFKQAYPEIWRKKCIKIIHNGIEEKNYKKIDSYFKKKILRQKNKNEFIVICISRWVYGKGLEYLIDAIPLVLKKTKNIKFILAGRKFESWENKINEYVEMIDNKIKRLGKNIICLNWINDKERNTLLSIADLSIMPSEIEYYPYSILEPAICKVPLISSKLDCVAEIFEENIDCLFFPLKDSNYLANQIIHLYNSKNTRKKISENSYNKIKKLCCWNTISKKYQDMYKSIL